mgnify:CR=1 FL=1
MIIEERGEMGTFCSLGISSEKIIFNYILYVLSSTIIGVIIGYFIGTSIIPPLVYTCLPANLPELTYQFNASILSTCMLVACIIMLAVTIFACMKELKRQKNITRKNRLFMEENIFLLESNFEKHYEI